VFIVSRIVTFKCVNNINNNYNNNNINNYNGKCYNEIGDLKISTVKIAIMRSRFVIGQLGCSNNPSV